MDSSKIYPDLRTIATEADEDAQQSDKIFRLSKIEQVQSEISKERDKRECMYKKYNKVVSFLSTTENVLDCIGAVFGIVGLTAIAGVVSAPIGIAFESATVGFVGLGLVFKRFSKKYREKAKKHDEIRVLAEAKLNTISDLVSQAVDDGDINHEEFVMINNELRKFNGMRDSIRNRAGLVAVSGVGTSPAPHQRDIDVEVEKIVAERLEKQKKDLIEKLGA